MDFENRIKNERKYLKMGRTYGYIYVRFFEFDGSFYELDPILLESIKHLDLIVEACEKLKADKAIKDYLLYSLA